MKNSHSLNSNFYQADTEGACYVINGNHNEVRLEVDARIMEKVCEKVYTRFCENFCNEVKRNSEVLDRIEKMLSEIERKK